MIDNVTELEQELIGILVIKPNRIDELVLPIECFDSKVHRKIVEIILKQWKEHHSTDLPAMIENYKELISKDINISDFIPEITSCVSSAPTDANFEYLQETLFQKYKKKLVIRQIKLFERNQISYEKFMDFIHDVNSKILFNQQKKVTGEEIYNMITRKSKRISFQYKTLTFFGNIQEHDLVILAARPGVGKTGFALNLCNFLSEEYKTIYFSMEMSQKQIYSRLLSIESHIDMKYLDNPQTKFQAQKVREFSDKVASKKLEVIYANQTLSSIKTKIIKESKKEHVIVFIDYVGLIYPSKRYSSIYERITDIVKELRVISLDFDCTIFLISQLNRQGQDKPRLIDLKDSGELEQAGTAVLLLSKQDNTSIADKEYMNLEIAKNRNGRIGVVEFIYDKNNQIFVEKKGE